MYGRFLGVDPEVRCGTDRHDHANEGRGLSVPLTQSGRRAAKDEAGTRAHVYHGANPAFLRIVASAARPWVRCRRRRRGICCLEQPESPGRFATESSKPGAKQPGDETAVQPLPKAAPPTAPPKPTRIAASSLDANTAAGGNRAAATAPGRHLNAKTR